MSALKLQILSDLHREMLYDRDKEQIVATDADVIILAGDIDNREAGVEWAVEQSNALSRATHWANRSSMCPAITR